MNEQQQQQEEKRQRGSQWDCGVLRDLQPVRVLGGQADGGSSAVLVTRKNFGGLYRLKIISKGSRSLADARREFEVMEKLLMRDISGFPWAFDFKEDEGHFYMLQSHNDGMPLPEFLAGETLLTEEDQAEWIRYTKRLIVKLSEMISDLHELGYCNDGLVAANIAIDAEAQPWLVDLRHVKAFQYQRLQEKRVLTEAALAKCGCYRQLRDLVKLVTSRAETLSQGYTSVPLSDFLGKLGSRTINSHPQLIQHPFIASGGRSPAHLKSARTPRNTGGSSANLPRPKILDEDMFK